MISADVEINFYLSEHSAAPLSSFQFVTDLHLINLGTDSLLFTIFRFPSLLFSEKQLFTNICCNFASKKCVKHLIPFFNTFFYASM